MKKLLVVTGLVLSSMMSYGQDKPKDDYKITLGVTSGVYHSTNFGGWISIGKIGVEYTKGSGKKELRSTPIDFTNIGVNYYFKKIFVGIGAQTVNTKYDNGTLPYLSVGSNYYFGNNDLCVVRGVVMTGGKGISTINLGLGVNF